MSRTAAVLGTLYLAALVLKRALALRYLSAERRRTARAGRTARLTATVVQPILSGDPALEATLERNVAELDGAPFRWLVDASDAEAQRVCAAVAARHAGRDIAIVRTPPAPDDVNPKTFKLAIAQDGVATDCVVVLDDDTTLSAAGCAALLDALHGADLSTGLPSYAPGTNLPSSLVAHFVNDNAALTYLSACALTEPVTISGMCYALRTGTLRAIGGFGAIAHELADDLAIARAVRAHGGRLHQTIVPHRTATTVPNAGRYVALMHRWYLFASLLLPGERAAVVALLIGLYLLPPVALLALVARAVLRPSAAAASAVAAVALARTALIADVQRRTLGEARHVRGVSLLAELLAPLHALHAALSRTIRWRSKRYRVRANGDFVRIA